MDRDSRVAVTPHAVREIVRSLLRLREDHGLPLPVLSDLVQQTEKPVEESSCSVTRNQARA